MFGVLPINIWAESKAGTLAEVRRLKSRIKKAQNQKKHKQKVKWKELNKIFLNHKMK